MRGRALPLSIVLGTAGAVAAFGVVVALAFHH